jgi:hypothetical protein
MIAKVTCLEDPGTSMDGRLANLSAHGLSLIIPGELPAGASVKVQWGNTDFVGQLLYCEPYGNEYRAGLQVDDPIYDSTPSPARKGDKFPDSPGKI